MVNLFVVTMYNEKAVAINLTYRIISEVTPLIICDYKAIK